MRFIAHRGNIIGKNLSRENSPDYILKAINLGYDVEIDVWFTEDGFFLGHDEPQYMVDINFLLTPNLWVHAKNNEALFMLHKKTNCFSHNTDDAVLTSKNFIWVYPGKTLVPDCIAVLPDKSFSIKAFKICYGICSDDINYWKEQVLKTL